MTHPSHVCMLVQALYELVIKAPAIQRLQRSGVTTPWASCLVSKLLELLHLAARNGHHICHDKPLHCLRAGRSCQRAHIVDVWSVPTQAGLRQQRGDLHGLSFCCSRLPSNLWCKPEGECQTWVWISSAFLEQHTHHTKLTCTQKMADGSIYYFAVWMLLVLGLHLIDGSKLLRMHRKALLQMCVDS